MAELQILQQFHPALTVEPWVESNFRALRAVLAAEAAPPVLREEAIERLYQGLLICHLAPATHAALTARLGLRSETQRLMAGLSVLHEQAATLADPALLPSAAVAILDQSTAAALALYLALDLAPPLTPVLRHYVEEWQAVRPSLNGRDLQALGIPRGPIYGEILAAIRAALLDGEIHNREEEIALARQIAG
ncbi:MAG: hypothetical protein R2867_36815 [Caldilineaceae bacterium]